MGNLIHTKTLGIKNTVIAILVLCFLISVMASCRLDRDDPREVASAFLESMMRNDAKAAKTLVSSERWRQIDAWVGAHQALDCSNREWETGTGGSGYSTDGDTWSYGLSFQCADAENLYCFSIDDIVLQQTETGWQVIEWGEICEKRNYCYACP